MSEKKNKSDRERMENIERAVMGVGELLMRLHDKVDKIAIMTGAAKVAGADKPKIHIAKESDIRRPH